MTRVTATLDQTDLRELQRKLTTLTGPTLERVVARAAPYTRDQARAGAPRHTGALVSSIVADGRGLEARVHSPLVYALPQEFGRHSTTALIAARPRRGTAGRFFLRRAVQMLVNGELPRLLRLAADELEAAWGRR